jgi:hypothetical protein
VSLPLTDSQRFVAQLAATLASASSLATWGDDDITGVAEVHVRAALALVKEVVRQVPSHGGAAKS